MLTQINAWTRGHVDKRLILSGAKGELFSSLNAQRSSYKSPSLSFDKLRTRRGGFRRGSSFIVHLSTKPST